MSGLERLRTEKPPIHKYAIWLHVWLIGYVTVTMFLAPMSYWHP